MSQHDLDISNAVGATVRSDINNALVALGSGMKGPSAPASPVAGMLWVDDDTPSATIWTINRYSGSAWIEIGLFDTTNNRFYWTFNNLAALTGPAVGDLISIYDLDTTTYKKITLQNLLLFINALTAETAPAEDDYLPLYDTSTGTMKRVSLAKLVAGTLAQAPVYSLITASQTTTTQIPRDNTIPQSGEGKEITTVTITPKSASNILEIRADLFVATPNTDDVATAALFQDATANALAACGVVAPNGGQPLPLSVVHYMLAGTVAATTFKLRVGADTSSTLTICGVSGGGLYGTLTRGSLVVKEYRAN